MANAVSPDNFQDLVDGIPANFNRVVFGSPIEAKVGGGFSSFRQSDSIDFISQEIASAPVSMVDRYPDIIDQVRTTFGLPPLLGTDTKPPATVPILDTGVDPNSGGTQLQANQQPATGSLVDWTGLTEWLQAWGVTIGWFAIGITLLGVGLFMLVYSTDTGRQTINDGAKSAGEALAG